MKTIKRFAATILSLGIVLTSSLMATAAEPAVQSATETSVHTQSDTEIYFVLGNGVRVRRSPGNSSEAVGLLYENRGDWVEVRLDNTTIADGLNWYQVVDSSTGVTGWIAGRYLDIVSPRTILPITYIK